MRQYLLPKIKKPYLNALLVTAAVERTGTANTPALTSIFNQSLRENRVPEDWKMANVTPIYKKVDKNVALKYRPMSLISVTGKILEKIIRDKPVTFLEENNIISDTTRFPK